jgi:8-oxo-dGTP pyrophosphatase MutT (NUDIX family)
MEIIWMNDQPLIICNHRSEAPEYIINQLKNIEFTIGVPADIRLVMKNLNEKNLDACIIETEDIPASLKLVTKHYHIWQAAGGLITNPEGHILLIFRRGKWDLPKGKLDHGETIEQCALREVSEETGLHTLSLAEKICSTYHTYIIREKDEKILKHTHWFKMSFTGSEQTIPQIEEDIIDIQWVKPENMGKYLQYSYANIRYLYHVAGGYTV